MINLIRKLFGSKKHYDKDAIDRIIEAKRKFPSMKVSNIGSLEINIKEARDTDDFERKLSIASDIVKNK